MASAAVDALLGRLESPEMASFVTNDNLFTNPEDLRFLKAFLEDPPQQFVRNGKLAELESMANKAASIVSSFDAGRMDYNMAWEMNRRLLGLGDEIEQIKREAKVIYDQIKQLPRANFPTTEQIDFIDYVVENLRELLKHKAASIDLFKHQIATVADLLPSLKAHWVIDIEELEEEEESPSTRIEELQKKNLELKDLRTRIMYVVYEIEYVTDCALSGFGPTWKLKFWLGDILDEIRLITEKATVEVYDKKRVIERLISDTEGLDVVSILKVPAASEAAPAEDIYNDPWVSHRFHVHGRCVVSQSYSKREREVLLGILESLYGRIGNEDYMSNGELAKLLYQTLSGRRCLIVMEDVWDIQAVNNLKRILGNRMSGSRIVLTTRFAEVAFKFPYAYVVNMDSTNRFQLFTPGDLDPAEGSGRDSSQTSSSMKDGGVVGFEKESETMYSRLFSKTDHLDVVSIVGMPGIGKTALAKKFYNDDVVKSRFDVMAWCSISETYDRRNILLQLLHCLKEDIHHDSDVHKMDNRELAELLYRHLCGWRYFIVLDDMWDFQVWNDLQRSFPDNAKGSRILLTTRLEVVAERVNPGREPLLVSLLRDEECWELLKSKVFGTGSCPRELLMLEEGIARKCKGLPLLVILVAGRLAVIEEKEDSWRQVEEDLNSLNHVHVDRMHMRVIESSYRYLPDHLKPCFLYFGGFPEDNIIPVQKLIRLWIAEGFVQHSDMGSLEAEAEKYLMDLIRRNLVMIAEVSWDGRVKGCRVHDLIREFCLVKAEDEKFCQRVVERDEYYTVSDNYLDRGTDPNHSHTSKPKSFDRRQLCIYSKRKDFIMSKPSGPRVRSLLCFASGDNHPSDPYDVSFMSENFKLLRVFDFEGFNIGYSFKGFELLVHLRYLAFECDADSIPLSVANLWNLETFLVKTSGAAITVPESIWGMARLRHVHIRNHAYFSLHHHRLENSSLLEYLQSFSTPSLSYGDDMEKILRRLPRLRKLRCIFLNSWDHSRNYNWFPLLDFLASLNH